MSDSKAAAGDVQSAYPNLEAFIRTASAEDIANVFKSVKVELETFKGPKAEVARKANVALERTEDLLKYLLQVRENMEKDGQLKK